MTKKDMQGFLQQNQLPPDKAQAKRDGLTNYPDYKGSLTVRGVRLWVSGWIHQQTPEKIAEGKPKNYLSLSLSEADGGECVLMAVPVAKRHAVEQFLKQEATADDASVDAAMVGDDEMPF